MIYRCLSQQASSWILTVPCKLLCDGSGSAQGASAGFSATAGLALDSLFHGFTAVLGLSVLLSYFPEAYTLLKIVGASYLIYPGLRHFGILFLEGKIQRN
jgi:hypothetical protein